MSWVRGIMPTCQEMTRLLSDAMDRSLPLHVRMRMLVHLVICTLCQRYQGQLRLIRQMLRKRGGQLEEVRIPVTIRSNESSSFPLLVTRDGLAAANQQ